MSIKLPQYTIQNTGEPSTKIKPFLIPLLIIVSFIIGYFGNSYITKNNLESLQQRNEVLESINASNQDKIVQKDAELSVLKTEKKVKQEAILLLQNDFKTAIKQQNSLKADISFYQRLLSPNAENKGLRVFSTKLKFQSDTKFNLKIILVQKIERAKEVSGTYKIIVRGNKNNANTSLIISDSGDSKYKFKYFQNISLDFSFPGGFKAEQLVVELIPNNKKSKTVVDTVDWISLTKPE